MLSSEQNSAHGALGEVGAVVSDDDVWEAVTVDEFTKELGGCHPVTLLSGLRLHPLCELVNYD
jgi:hypothetical protein